MDNVSSIDWWEKRLGDGGVNSDNPLNNVPLSVSSKYLYAENTSPVPSAITAGIWRTYPDAKSLAAGLRHHVLPFNFSIWLCRDEWDETPLAVRSLEEIFDGAERADNRYRGDIQLMTRIMAQVDAAIGADSDEESWACVQAACNIANERWERTSSWNFILRVFDSPLQVAEHLIEQEQADMEEDELRELAKRALVNDEEARREFQDLLHNTVLG